MSTSRYPRHFCLAGVFVELRVDGGLSKAFVLLLSILVSIRLFLFFYLLRLCFIRKDQCTMLYSMKMQYTNSLAELLNIENSCIFNFSYIKVKREHSIQTFLLNPSRSILSIPSIIINQSINQEDGQHQHHKSPRSNFFKVRQHPILFKTYWH